ncbi:sarcosine oxidase subunit gamma [Pseudoponticoccus marisrubri]|uniref:Sarcosine oxidase subunit gamma n=1 Tax=Pseudoponticoccus marisrubri TaxID=1685382 RepID=A0A0W7WF37_9RHOB|nr:hypothetical protein [Pseudoponticoccus marisrubri]KUF09259.1 hypothetical protein AVJ23_18570 [Pseudoponticoccus marisrubri]
MVELTAQTPWAALLPVTAGATGLSAWDPGPMTALMPYRGRRAALSEAMQAAHGLGFPDPGEVTAAPPLRCLWTGRGQAFLMGGPADPGLSAQAALVDQSDGWVALRLEGETAPEVLARLVPVDLRPAALPEGRTLRTLCGHMTVSITRAPEGLEILAFRSMAGTLVHEIADAMRLVAGRAVLG